MVIIIIISLMSVFFQDSTGFLEMEASLRLNGRSQNVAKGWLSTKCCWEAAVHTLDLSWKKIDVKTGDDDDDDDDDD